MFEVSGGVVPWRKDFLFENKRMIKPKPKPQLIPQEYGIK
jgi:hypothetical protein